MSAKTIEKTKDEYITLQHEESKDTAVLYKGMTIGFIERSSDGYLFIPYVEWDEDEMTAYDADTMDELLTGIILQTEGYSYDLLEARVKAGWTP